MSEVTFNPNSFLGWAWQETLKNKTAESNKINLMICFWYQ